jgi:hypothetical protein
VGRPRRPRGKRVLRPQLAAVTRALLPSREVLVPLGRCQLASRDGARRGPPVARVEVPQHAGPVEPRCRQRPVVRPEGGPARHGVRDGDGRGGVGRPSARELGTDRAGAFGKGDLARRQPRIGREPLRAPPFRHAVSPSPTHGRVRSRGGHGSLRSSSAVRCGTPAPCRNRAGGPVREWRCPRCLRR